MAQSLNELIEPRIFQSTRKDPIYRSELSAQAKVLFYQGTNADAEKVEGIDFMSVYFVCAVHGWFRLQARTRYHYFLGIEIRVLVNLGHSERLIDSGLKTFCKYYGFENCYLWLKAKGPKSLIIIYQADENWFFYIFFLVNQYS